MITFSSRRAPSLVQRAMQKGYGLRREQGGPGHAAAKEREALGRRAIVNAARARLLAQSLEQEVA